jgi:ribulose bisphosphate carboxylase small subunit
MNSGPGCATVVKLPCLSEVERNIENLLSEQWILRVEHVDGVNPVRTQWKQWGKSLYGVDDTVAAIDGIRACRARYPADSIRLCAEKMQPPTKFINWVHTPGGNTGCTAGLEHQTASAESRGGGWLGSVANVSNAARARMWRIVTVMGMLLASVLVLEEAIA